MTVPLPWRMKTYETDGVTSHVLVDANSNPVTFYGSGSAENCKMLNRLLESSTLNAPEKP